MGYQFSARDSADVPLRSQLGASEHVSNRAWLPTKRRQSFAWVLAWLLGIIGHCGTCRGRSANVSKRQQTARFEQVRSPSRSPAALLAMSLIIALIVRPRKQVAVEDRARRPARRHCCRCRALSSPTPHRGGTTCRSRNFIETLPREFEGHGAWGTGPPGTSRSKRSDRRSLERRRVIASLPCPSRSIRSNYG